MRLPDEAADDEAPPPDLDRAGDEMAPAVDPPPAGPLTEQQIGAMTVELLKARMKARGLSTNGNKSDLQQRLRDFSASNPQFDEVTDGLQQFKSLTPVQNDDEGKWGYEESFPRPAFAGMNPGGVRMHHLKSKPKGVGRNHVPAQQLGVLDHPMHYLELYFDGQWMKDNLVTPSREAADLDGIPNRVYPEYKQIELEDEGQASEDESTIVLYLLQEILVC
eukprot:COSAG02_NODE_5185_length_4558_cov_49.830680_2_plen_220_part_00